VENVVAEWAAQRPTQEVIKTCSQSGVKASKVQSIEDVAESTHLEQRGAFDQVNYGGESMRLPVSPYTSAKRSASETESREAPEVGEHTDQILSEILGYDRATLEQLRSENVIN
jgi:crotonobetainyl-CoA:carnitine CoA-transferase CaiB-like acyl-CoA transferase